MSAKVSIIVPIYNVEPYLERCINSIRRQTVKELEVILVDDGSLDRCPQMCDQFAAEDRRIKVIHQPNAGVSVARNRGMDVATADWIMFVDPDDWLEDNAVEVLYQAGMQFDCDLICALHYFNKGKVQTVALNSCKTGFFQIEDARDVMLKDMFGYRHSLRELSLNSPWAKLYKKSALNDDCCFPIGMKQSQDCIFNLNVVMSIKSVFITNVPVYHYYQRVGSVWNRFNPNLHEMIRRKNDEVFLFLERFKLMEEYREYYNYMVIESVIQLFKYRCSYASSLREIYAMLPELIAFLESNNYTESIFNTRISFMLSIKRKIELWLLKKHMYKTLVLLGFVQAKCKTLIDRNQVHK